MIHIEDRSGGEAAATPDTPTSFRFRIEWCLIQLSLLLKTILQQQKMASVTTPTIDEDAFAFSNCQ